LLLGFPGKAEAISIFEPPDFSNDLGAPTDLGSFDDPDYPANIGGTLSGDVPQDLKDIVQFLHTGTDGLFEITLIVSSFVPHPLFTCVSFFVNVGDGASTNSACPSEVGSESFSMFVNSGDEVEIRLGLNGNLIGTSATYELEINLVPETPVVGGEFLSIDTTALLLAGAQSFSWMIPVILSGIGIGLFVVSRKSE